MAPTTSDLLTTAPPTTVSALTTVAAPSIASPTTGAPPQTTRLPGAAPTAAANGTGGGSPPAAPKALITPAGVVVPVLGPAPGGGWTVRTPCGRTATLTGGSPAGTPAIVLDPGHGGSESGAVSPGGLAESGVNLSVARYAQEALKASGVPTLLDRSSDYTVELPVRAEIARSVAPKAFVSVHHNADPDGPWPRPGSETYYQLGSTESRRLAGLIYEEVAGALSQYRVAWTADRDAGAKYRPGRQGDYYAMLRLPGTVVSVLSELAFISNPPEAELLARADVQRVEGRALARGIVRWLRSSEPGSGYTEPYPRTEPPSIPGGEPPPCADPQL